MDYFKDLLPVANAFANDPNLKEWEGWSRESFERVLNELFDSKDFLNSVILLNGVVNGDLQAPSIPLELENLLTILKNAKEQKKEIRDKAINDVQNYIERLKKTYLPLAEASKQRPVEKKEKNQEEKWRETQEKLTLKIQNQLIAFDQDLAEDPELLEELTEEIKTGVVSLALTEDETELGNKLKPLASEVLTKNGYLINSQKQEAFTEALYESSQKEIQEIRTTNNSPIAQEILDKYALNNENVIFSPAYVLANPSLALAYTQKALVALPVKFLQQSANETSPQWQKMLKEGVFVENYDLTIKNLIASGLSENHPTIIKLQRERDRLYEAQKTSEGKDKPVVGFLKTFFKPNELTGNQKGASETTGIALSGKTLWASGKGWAFNLKGAFNQLGLASKIYQKFPSLPGKTLITSKLSIGALAWSSRRLWRPVYLAVAKTAAGKAVKVGIKKASAWVATKLGLQAAITAAGVGTGVGAAPAIAINLIIEAASLITDKLIKPFLRKIKENPLATIALGVGIMVIVPSFAIIGVTIAAIGVFTAMAGAGAILGGIAIGTLGFFTALVGGPVVGFSIATAVIIGVIALSSLTFFIVMTTAGAFILPVNPLSLSGGLRNLPPTIINPKCSSLPDLFTANGNAQCVPPGLLMAISSIEASGIWGLDCTMLGKFTTDKWWENATPDEITTGYCYDTCAATKKCPFTTVMGAMQFEEKTWLGWMPGYTAMDRCRLDLSIEAAAKKIKNNSGTGPGECSSWSEQAVRQAAYRYCGSCGSEGCKSNPDPNDPCDGNACGVDYCGTAWLRYQQYAGQ